MCALLPLCPCAPACSDGELKEGESVCILGGTAQLGNWQLQEVLAMVPISPDTWEAEVGGRDAVGGVGDWWGGGGRGRLAAARGAGDGAHLVVYTCGRQRWAGV